MSEFDWIRDRFDRVDEDNKEINDTVQVIKEKVNRHDTYWSLTKWIASGAAGSATAIAAFFGFHQK